MYSRPALIAVASIVLFAPGCYTSSPQLWETSVENYTWVSTPARPVTITLVDTRDDSEFFKMEIPVGQQLSIHFDDGSGDDKVKMSAKMTWELLESPSAIASLSNSLNAPPMFARRIDYAVRPVGEYAPDAAHAAMRVEPDPTPAYVTPAGGPGPSPNSKKLYE